MAKSGPPPKPTALRVLQGTAKASDLDNEPRPEGDVRRPYGLKTKHPHLAKLWDTYAPMLERMELLTAADQLAYLMMLSHAAIARECLDTVKEEGLTRRDENGVERKHPLLQVFRDNSTQFRMYAQEFGLTPSARARLGKELEGEVGETMDDFFKMLNQAKEESVT